MTKTAAVRQRRSTERMIVRARCAGALSDVIQVARPFAREHHFGTADDAKIDPADLAASLTTDRGTDKAASATQWLGELGRAETTGALIEILLADPEGVARM